MEIEKKMRKAILEYGLIPEDGRIAIALSGGKDSLTLLHLLRHISGRGFPKLDLVAIHIQGVFSCGAGVDLPYLHTICEGLEVPLIVRESPLTEEKLSCYPCSRVRRNLLFEAAKERGIHTLALGHHRDDNIQTLLMNLLHKGEFAGNLPKLHMVHYQMTLIRPLILVPETTIRTYAQEQGFSRITCQCPIGAQSMRKKVADLIGDIETLFPHVRENLSHASLLYGSEKARQP